MPGKVGNPCSALITTASVAPVPRWCWINSCHRRRRDWRRKIITTSVGLLLLRFTELAGIRHLWFLFATLRAWGCATHRGNHPPTRRARDHTVFTAFFRSIALLTRLLFLTPGHSLKWKFTQLPQSDSPTSWCLTLCLLPSFLSSLLPLIPSSSTAIAGRPDVTQVQLFLLPCFSSCALTSSIKNFALDHINNFIGADFLCHLLQILQEAKKFIQLFTLRPLLFSLWYLSTFFLSANPFFSLCFNVLTVAALNLFQLPIYLTTLTTPRCCWDICQGGTHKHVPSSRRWFTM